MTQRPSVPTDKQDVPQNTLRSIVPELATGWAWNEEGTELTFPLRQAVKWHDGKPFTAADVKCTIDLLQGTGSEKLRINPRKTWYSNVEEVTTNGDYEVTLHLKQPQPSILALLCLYPPAPPVYPPGAPTTFAPANIQPDLVFPFPDAATSGGTANNQTFRSIIKPDLWGNTMRFRFSNTFGSQPVTFSAVTVGLQEYSGNVVDGTMVRAAGW